VNPDHIFLTTLYELNEGNGKSNKDITTTARHTRLTMQYNCPRAGFNPNRIKCLLDVENSFRPYI